MVRDGCYQVPPRRLELRSSAPEADTLSTELRGRTEGILSQIKQLLPQFNCGINKDCHTRPKGSLAMILALRLSPWRQLYQFTAQLRDDFSIPALLAHFDELFLLMRQLTTDLVKACGLAKCTGG